ncbi:hypothetical protein [Paenibacillus sp. GP183]|uniref:hypothetical protein n=1 Tax=Paenibacillus sp. GP183 TaxID=1882751 RepID=UPI000896ECF3|nr:hypothetical protein [Paenibacillus sp. GP183]SEB54101.1 hypothetical protein SAMN05443246_0971 [Paenibacillus sp. GP183]
MKLITQSKSLWRLLLAVLLLLAAVPHAAGAAAVASPKLSVELLSPTQVKDYPGIEQMVKANVTNLTDQPIPDVMAYITLADLGKHMTVNLEDYSADKPVVMGTLQPKETRTVELPIRFVYTSTFFLYVTAMSSQFNNIQSSVAIPVEIISNSSMDPSLVAAVSIGMPALLLIVIAAVFMLRWKQRRDSALS